MTPDKNNGLLSQIRIVDLTLNLAGPYGTRLLSMLGAEVIRVEHSKKLDVFRRRSATDFNAANAGKKSVTLNLKTEKAIELAKNLIAISDVVVSSYRPGVLDKLGLGYEEVRKLKPDILMVDFSGFGATGPERHFASWASIFAAMSGHSYITGYHDSIATEFRGSFDTRCGQSVALAVLMGLIHRQKTGQGQHVDIAAVETQICSLGEGILDYSMNGRITERHGNRHTSMAPHNAYRCNGDDCWVSIAAGSDEEWTALCNAMGQPELAEDERFKDPLSRWENQGVLDEIITLWTCSYTDYEVMEILQKAGVAAIPVMSSEEIFNDPHLKERNFFVEVNHPEMGKVRLVRPPWNVDGKAAGKHEPAPLIGEHNDYIFRTLLGMSEVEIDRLVEEQVIY